MPCGQVDRGRYMLFSSITFLYYFLPVTLTVYFLTPKKRKNLVLLFASLLFYGWGEPKYVAIMLLSIAVQYAFGLIIEKHRHETQAKAWLAASVAFSLGLLGYFKYMDFFIANFNAVTGLSVPLLRISLPIGISFYTFQILSYTIDVYRGDVKAQRSLVKLATYIALFPQLIAGPIVRYADVAAALESRTHSVRRMRLGLGRLMIGLSKKVLIANSLGELCALFGETQNETVLFAWMYAAAFTLQIYFDFSGYSDMAIGLGRMLGFDYMENFNYPLVSKSITEFWRRWHISLGSWFRDYLYIPLGGNRVTNRRWLFNIFAVWMLTGLWHGAAWNFVLWGLLFAVFLVLEKFWIGQRLAAAPGILSHAYVLIIVGVSFVLFDAPSLTEAVRRLGLMAGAGGIPLTDTVSLYYLRSYAVTFLLAAIGSTPWPKHVAERLRTGRIGQRTLGLAEPVVAIVLLLAITAYLVDSSFNPFLYFRF